MTPRRKLLIVVAAAPVLLIVLALLYLNVADLSGWRDTVTRLASDAIGRELRIEGEFLPEIGFTTRVVATDITLANADWSDEPHMVSVDRLEGELDLLSLAFGPIAIRDVEITGGSVFFELDAEGRFNWALGSGEPGGGGAVELVIGRAQVRNLQLVYTAPQKHALEARLSSLELTDDGTGMLDLNVKGSIEGTPLEISGRLGTFIGLINAAAVEHDLTGRLADAELALRGTIDDLGSLSGIKGVASASGPDLSLLTGIIGIDPVVDGPFTVEASVTPSVAGSDVAFEVSAGGITTTIDGTVDSLTKPTVLDVTVDASGPNVATIGKLTGIEGLRADPFSVSGQLRWEGFPVSCKSIEVRVGDNRLSAHGVLGEPPLMLGTDFTLRGEGADLSALGAVVGINLPRERYSISSRVVRTEGGIRVENGEIRVGRTTVRVIGAVGDPPRYDGTTLSIHAEGPNLAQLDSLIGVKLPAREFTVDGRLATGEHALALEGVSALIGDIALRVEGALTTTKGLAGTTLRIEAQGADAAQLRDLTGLTHLPTEAWTLTGGLAFVDSGLRLDEASVSVGALQARGDGFVATTRGALGTDLEFQLEDPLLSHGAAIFGWRGLPDLAVRADGRFEVVEGGYRLGGVTGAAGDIDLAVDGVIGRGQHLDGSRLDLEARGSSLASVGAFVHRPGLLPPVPFSATGELRIAAAVWETDGLTAEVDGNRIAVAGSVMPSQGLRGSDLRIDLAGPDLARAGALAAGFLHLPRLPAERFSLATGLRIDDAGYRIDGLRITVADAVAAFDGRIGRPPDFLGTDLEFTSDGPGTGLIEQLAGIAGLPNLPFSVSGRCERTSERFIGENLEIRLGESDLHGAFVVDITGKPTITARLSSTTLDLGDLFPRQIPSGGEPETPSATPPQAGTRRVFGDETIDFSPLRRVDADVEFDIDVMKGWLKQFRNVELGARLIDGRLEIHPFDAAGERGGRGSGTLVLEPSAGGYRLLAELDLDTVRLDIPGQGAEAAAAGPPFDLDVELEAVGRTPHDLALSSNGTIRMVAGNGVVDSRMLDLITADILRVLLRAFNPFAKEDPTTELQCAVALLTLGDGTAVLDPMVAQSDKMTLLGSGKVDLGTEKLDLAWVTKPRKGIGISASMITNPYIKLGGTLASPAVELKPLEAVTSTGVAVATMGISLVAKGMLDRITAEKKVCEKALEEIQSRTRGRPE